MGQPSELELVLADLNSRLDRGIAALRVPKANESAAERARLNAKAEGLAVVKDWLRSY